MTSSWLRFSICRFQRRHSLRERQLRMRYHLDFETSGRLSCLGVAGVRKGSRARWQQAVEGNAEFLFVT
jgi:hypothetical protein